VSYSSILANASTDKGRLVNAVQAAIHNHALDLEGMIPAQVVSYDRAKNLATVKPLIMRVDIDDNKHSRFTLSQIPVMSMGGGGFHINFPLVAGDIGWIFAADRDIDTFLQTLTESDPPTGRLHTFEQGMFIPDVFYKYTINAADSASMVIQTTDGSTRVSISKGKISITAPTSVTVTAPNVNVAGNLVISGMTSANGGFNATGGGNQACTLPQDTTINGISVANHGHTQQNNGSGRTAGGMIT
jgi:Phage protein Gp138 N-terminal domain